MTEPGVCVCVCVHDAHPPLATGKDRVGVFGGISRYSTYRSFSHVLDTITLVWTRVGDTDPRLTPANRRGHAALSHDGQMYIHGGGNSFVYDDGSTPSISDPRRLVPFLTMHKFHTEQGDWSYQTWRSTIPVSVTTSRVLYVAECCTRSLRVYSLSLTHTHMNTHTHTHTHTHTFANWIYPIG